MFIYTHLNEDFILNNNQGGFLKLIDKLLKLQPNSIVMEATGGLEQNLAIALQNTGLNTAIINPRQIIAVASQALEEEFKLMATPHEHFQR